MIDEIFMALLKDKKSALKSILKDIDKTGIYSGGLDQFLETIDTCDLEEVDIRKKLKTIMKVLSSQNAILRKLLFITLIYMQGNTFDSDAGNALVKMGRGEEALKQMFKNKMG